MEIKQIKNRTPELIDKLIPIWESSVRATHDFLTESAIEYFKDALPEIFKQVPVLLVAFDEAKEPVGFIGLSGSEIEMLFIAANTRGQGIGKSLITEAIQNFGATELTVNEQNPQAVGFYQHLGFETYRRSNTDDSGNPYPILHMRLKKD